MARLLLLFDCMADEHLAVLQGIWGEMKTMNGRINTLVEGQTETNARLDQTNARLDQTNVCVEQMSARLEHVARRQVESETRIATELIAVVSAVREVRDVVREDRFERQRLDRLEHRVDALEKRSA